MKRFRISLFALAFTGLFVTSCQKDDVKTTPAAQTTVAPENTQNKPITADKDAQLFERSLKVFDAGKTIGATLRFKSANKELLAKMPVEQFEFKLTKAEAPGISQKKPASSSLGLANFSDQNANRQLQGKDELKNAKDVVYVDLVTDTKAEAMTVEIKSKALNGRQDKVDLTAAALFPYGTRLFFQGSYWWHFLQINNLASTPLQVYFYYNSCIFGTCWSYSGYSYTLYKNGWAWYRNCTRGVAAYIYVDYYSYWYKWTWRTFC
jgi:hypothetical protein